VNPLFATSALGATLQDSMTIMLDLDQYQGRPVPEDIAAHVRHFWGLDGSPMFSGDPRAIFDSIERKHGLDGAGMYVAFVTGLLHEIRHVHDLLATGSTLENFDLSYVLFRDVTRQCAILRRWLDEDPARAVPLPLGSCQEDSGLPEEVLEFVRVWRLARARLDADAALTGPSFEGITARHLLETAAIHAQFEFAEQLFGQDGPRILRRLVYDGGKARDYLDHRDDLVRRMRPKGWSSRDIAFVSSFVIWSALQRAVPKTMSEEAPEVMTLYHVFLEEVLAKAKVPTAKEVRAVIRNFCHATGLLDPIETAEVHVRLAKRRAVGMGIDPDAAPTDARATTTPYRRAYEDMIAHIDRRPDDFFDPLGYIHGVNEGKWPAPFLTVRHGGRIDEIFLAGKRIIPASDWSAMAASSGMFNILMHGHGRTPLAFAEPNLFEGLKIHGLRFRDPFFD